MYVCTTTTTFQGCLDGNGLYNHDVQSIINVPRGNQVNFYRRINANTGQHELALHSRVHLQ